MSFYSRVVDTIQERNGWAYCVYLDLKKAFDKVPHRKLLWKLKHNGGLRGPPEMDGKFLDEQRNENGSERSKIIMEGSHKWSTPRLSTCTNHVCSLYK